MGLEVRQAGVVDQLLPNSIAGNENHSLGTQPVSSGLAIGRVIAGRKLLDDTARLSLGRRTLTGDDNVAQDDARKNSESSMVPVKRMVSKHLTGRPDGSRHDTLRVVRGKPLSLWRSAIRKSVR